VERAGVCAGGEGGRLSKGRGRESAQGERAGSVQGERAPRFYIFSPRHRLALLVASRMRGYCQQLGGTGH
jgi:hypothetical protein